VPWLLVDLLLGVLALLVLALVVLGLWRKVKALSREVSRAGEAIGSATDSLAQLQAVGEQRKHGEQPGPSTAAVRPSVNSKRRRV